MSVLTAVRDTLNGNLGADTMIGGTGNDTYFVDNSSDVVSELSNKNESWPAPPCSWSFPAPPASVFVAGASSDDVVEGIAGPGDVAGPDECQVFDIGAERVG